MGLADTVAEQGLQTGQFRWLLTRRLSTVSTQLSTNGLLVQFLTGQALILSASLSTIASTGYHASQGTALDGLTDRVNVRCDDHEGGRRKRMQSYGSSCRASPLP